MLETLRQRWEAINPSQRKLITVLGLATALTAGGALFALKSRGAMTPLYSGLAPAETREIVTELSRQGIDYKVSGDETSVSVPTRQEPVARMKLAAAGLPRSAPEKGWEIFGDGGLAVTKPQQRALQIRALQGELARSISSLESVSKASVHISLKEDTPFIEQREPAKAAVLLHIKPGAHLGREQATSIAYLVARSVPDLETAQVTILDEKGNLLFSDNVARGSNDGDTSHEVERELERRVQSQLDQTFGLGKTIVRATVSIESERSEVTRQVYKTPEGQTAGVPAKDTTETEDYSGSGPPGGRAGGAPGTGANLMADAGRAGAGGNAGRYTRSNTTKELLYNEEKEVLVKPAGGIQRITLGIFVDDALKDSTTKIQTVAGSAAGIDTKRGDTVSVETVKFAPSPTDSFSSSSRMEMIKTVLRLILNTLALVIGLLTLRSIIAALRPAQALHGSFVADDGLAGDGDMPLLTGGSGSPRAAEPALLEDGAAVGGPLRELAAPKPELPPVPTPAEQTAEELIGRVEHSPVDDIAEVLRHWLEGGLDG
jgi:flagellar M-ring protein FliF